VARDCPRVDDGIPSVAPGTGDGRVGSPSRSVGPVVDVQTHQLIGNDASPSRMHDVSQRAAVLGCHDEDGVSEFGGTSHSRLPSLVGSSSEECPSHSDDDVNDVAARILRTSIYPGIDDLDLVSGFRSLLLQGGGLPGGENWNNPPAGTLIVGRGCTGESRVWIVPNDVGFHRSESVSPRSRPGTHSPPSTPSSGPPSSGHHDDGCLGGVVWSACIDRTFDGVSAWVGGEERGQS